MDMYEITKGTEEQRQQVREWLYGLDYLSEDKQEKVITAWLTAWQNSVYDNLEDMAYSSLAPSYTLKSHVNEVTRSEEHTSELQSRFDLVCRLLLEKKKTMTERVAAHVIREGVLWYAVPLKLIGITGEGT